MTTEDYKGFQFRFVNDASVPGAIRVYVLRHACPSYNGRSTDLNTIHLWPAGRDGFNHPPYLCFKSGREPRSLETAKSWARDWATRTLAYIQTGRTISQQIQAEG